MTQDELIKMEVFIEEYGGGFIIADYSNRAPTTFGARYRGKDKEGWRMQPMVNDPFDTKDEAVAAASEEFA